MPHLSWKKLWRRRSVEITRRDPTFKVVYLGNVLTGWAKGEGCIDKPLSTLWRNYCQNSRSDIAMKVTVCGSGLRAVTEEHGLTEYWAHRITFCAAHAAYPRVFCWVYRHEGRRLKQELRCHAVLCPKRGKAEVMASELRCRLSVALHEFRREKVLRQQARLSVVNAANDAVCVPMRKLFLVTGAANYRPPLERSKSAPKLGAIEEEEDEDEDADADADAEPPSPVPLAKKVSDPGVAAPGGPDQAVVLVYEQVDESPLGDRASPPPRTPQEELLFYPPGPPSPARTKGEPLPGELTLLESLKGLGGDGVREESLTSDQPESLGSHSCASSCGEDAAPDEDGLIESEPVKAPLKGEEDNISEESGYSEDKECVPFLKV